MCFRILHMHWVKDRVMRETVPSFTLGLNGRTWLLRAQLYIANYHDLYSHVLFVSCRCVHIPEFFHLFFSLWHFTNLLNHHERTGHRCFSRSAWKRCCHMLVIRDTRTLHGGRGCVLVFWKQQVFSRSGLMQRFNQQTNPTKCQNIFQASLNQMGHNLCSTDLRLETFQVSCNCGFYLLPSV